MNGAESLVHTLLESGVDTCFANPGTSEMHFVSALDRISGMRSVLCLFEGAVTGAADGYARMTGKPAATLLHLGPGLAYGGPNLHNARRAKTPVVNIVGDHATYHRAYDAPLTSDIASISKGVSDWTHSSDSATDVARDAAAAVAEARRLPGQVATLILPADTAWTEAEGAAAPMNPPEPAAVPDARVAEVAAELRAGGAALVIGDRALTPEMRALAQGIATATGAELLAPGSNRRIDRGRGTVPVERIPYDINLALDRLKGFQRAVLVGCAEPVAFFAYPGKPSRLFPEGCPAITLAAPEEDVDAALHALAKAVGATPAVAPVQAVPQMPEDGPLTAESIAAALAALIPEDGIVCDESITVGRAFYPASVAAAPHTWLQITGGAIGCSVPLATGAAVACPDRPVIAAVGDGSALYSLQALWTQAREQLNVVTLVLANRSYDILKGELARVGAQMGETARDMLTLDRPAPKWVALAEGFGVSGTQVSSVSGLANAVQDALAAGGPHLIEVVVAES